MKLEMALDRDSGVPLTEQVPTLVQFNFDLFKPNLIVVGQLVLPVHALLLMNESLDSGDERFIRCVL